MSRNVNRNAPPIVGRCATCEVGRSSCLSENGGFIKPTVVRCFIKCPDFAVRRRHRFGVMEP